MHELFPDFACPVPKAFAPALGCCRFERGDTFYNSEDGYRKWSEAIERLQWSITVLHPPPRVTTSEVEDETLFFSASWNSSVTLDFVTYAGGRQSQTIKTTQGRLYYTLLTGNVEYISNELPVPQQPTLVTDANRLLAPLRRESLLDYITHKRDQHLFVFAVDPCQPASEEKLLRVRKALSSYEAVEQITIDPKTLFFGPAFQFFPTLRFVGFLIDTKGTETLRDRLKSVLYKPSKDRKTAKDRFNLRRHGLFLTPREAAPKKEPAVLSLSHGNGHFYRFRYFMRKPIPPTVKDFFSEIAEGDMPPNDVFRQGPTSSKLRISINEGVLMHRGHEIIEIATRASSIKKFKSRHENLQVYFMENDPATICVELPVWLHASEDKNHSNFADDEATLTGHIDLVRWVDDLIWIWDYKPNAFHERFAAGQVWSYAIMLSARTGLPLERIRCGYFDETIAFTLEPKRIDIPLFCDATISSGGQQPDLFA